MKVLVGAFNQEKALVGAFSVIVQPVVEAMDLFAALEMTLRVNDAATAEEGGLNLMRHRITSHPHLSLV